MRVLREKLGWYGGGSDVQRARTSTESCCSTARTAAPTAPWGHSGDSRFGGLGWFWNSVSKAMSWDTHLL